MNKKQQPTERIIEDAVLAGILETFSEITDVLPEKPPNGRVQFRIVGDVETALSKIYQNHPIGALDALKAIKSARQAIFSLKGNGYERYGNQAR